MMPFAPPAIDPDMMSWQDAFWVDSTTPILRSARKDPNQDAMTPIQALEMERRRFFMQFFKLQNGMQPSWPQVTLEQCVSFIRCGSAQTFQYLAPYGTPVIRGHHLHFYDLILYDAESVILPDDQDTPCMTVRAGDVLLSTIKKDPRCAMVPPDIGQAFIGPDVFLLRPYRIKPAFMAAYLTSPYGMRELAEIMPPVGYGDFTMDDLACLPIFVPPKALQGEFVHADRAWARKLKAMRQQTYLIYHQHQQQAQHVALQLALPQP